MSIDAPFRALPRDDLSEDHRYIHDELGRTTNLVTHDITEALLPANRIGVIMPRPSLMAGRDSDKPSPAEVRLMLSHTIGLH
jgi:osmoprotectant transport system ATP-binding protein